MRVALKSDVGSILNLLWAGLEAVSQRASTAIVSLILAIATGPSTVGYYAACFLAFGFIQGCVEAPMRLAAPKLIRSEAGASFVTRVARVGGIASSAFLIPVVFVLGHTLKGDGANGFAMLPMAVTPLVAGFVIPRVVIAQSLGRWRNLAASRTILALSSLAVTVPTLIFTGSLLAAASQLFLVELGMLFWLLRGQLTRLPSSSATNPSSRSMLAMLRDNVLVQTLGWCRGQLDRVILIFIASSAVMGNYSLAQSLALVPVTALLVGNSNYLRTALSTSDDTLPTARKITTTVTLRSIALAAVYYVVLLVLGLPVLGHFLGKNWEQVLPLIAILGLSIFPKAHNYSLSGTLLHFGEKSRILPSQIIGLVGAVVVGVAVSHDLLFGCLLYVARDLVTTCVLAFMGRKYITARSTWAWTGALILGVTLCWWIVS